MEQFKKKLMNMAGGITAYAIAFLAAAIALIVCGIFLNNREDYVPFNPLNNGYASLDVMYLMGPFAEETDEEHTSKEFFIAEASDQMWYVLGTKPNTDLPIYGEDISDADLVDLSAQTVYGKSEQIPGDLGLYLADFFSGSDFGITSFNYSEYFGTHYLDTTVTASHEWDIFYYLAGFMALLGLIFFFSGNKQRKLVKQQISEWESDGQLTDLYDDFACVDSIYDSKLRLAISHHYLLDFAGEQGGVRKINLSEIENVFLCNMIAGQPTASNYIALENKETRYCVAKSPRKTKEFDLILDRLKTDVEKEKTL